MAPTPRLRSRLMPNTHRRRDETVELRRVCGVYMNSQLALTRTADGFEDVNAAVGRDQVYNNSAANAIEVRYDVTYDAACL